MGSVRPVLVLGVGDAVYSKRLQPSLHALLLLQGLSDEVVTCKGTVLLVTRFPKLAYFHDHGQRLTR